DWIHDSIYEDLLTFESDLAKIASLVIIPLESAGAIAELGCFASNDQLREKLLVIISQKHFDKKSFIKLGPLRRIPESNILAYPYDPKSPNTTIDPYLEAIHQSIKEYGIKLHKSTTFKKDNN